MAAPKILETAVDAPTHGGESVKTGYPAVMWSQQLDASANLELSRECGSESDVLKMRVVGESGKRVTILTLNPADPANKEAWQLIQELGGKENGEINLGHVVSAVKENHGLSKVIGRQRIIMILFAALAVLLFGTTLGTSVLGGSLLKETHIQQSHVLTAGNNVVEVTPAMQDVPLEYLPFMDVHLLASTIGKTIMYTWNQRVVYDTITDVSKPVNETVYEAQIHTPKATIVIKPAEATLLVDGQATELCGAITCSKVSLTMEDDLHAIMEKALGEEGARRLHGRCQHGPLDECDLTIEQKNDGVDCNSVGAPEAWSCWGSRPSLVVASLVGPHIGKYAYVCIIYIYYSVCLRSDYVREVPNMCVYECIYIYMYILRLSQFTSWGACLNGHIGGYINLILYNG